MALIDTWINVIAFLASSRKILIAMKRMDEAPQLIKFVRTQFGQLSN